MNTLTLALVVFSCAIVVFFSKEFADSIKKVLAIPGMKLFLPLIIVSFIVQESHAELAWVLTKLQFILFSLITALANSLPFGWFSNYLATLIFLLALTLLPVLAIDTWFKRKTYNEFKYRELALVFIWLFFAVLFSVV